VFQVDRSSGGTLGNRADHHQSSSTTPRAAPTTRRRVSGRSGVRVRSSAPWRLLRHAGVSAHRASGRPVGGSCRHAPRHGGATPGCLEGDGDSGRVPSTCNPADARGRRSQDPGRGSPQHGSAHAAGTSRTTTRAAARTLTSRHVLDVPHSVSEVMCRSATGERSACGVHVSGRHCRGRLAGAVPRGSLWRAVEAPRGRGMPRSPRDRT
jgi:hypothetical protein